MALHWNWGDTEAWKNPIILNYNHPKYQLVKEHVETRDSYWRKDEETGEIVCTQPLLETVTWLALSMDLGGVTQENVLEWRFRMKYGRRVGWLWGDEGTMSEWTETGWKRRDITLDDLRTVIGLTTNVADLTRKQWLKRVHEYVVSETEKEVRNA